MPLYEFSCRSCGHRFETLRRLSDPTDGVECPSCRKPEASRQISAPAAFPGAGAGSGGGACAPRGGFT